MKPMNLMRVSNSGAKMYLDIIRLTNHTVWIRHTIGVGIVNTKVLKEQPQPQTYSHLSQIKSTGFDEKIADGI